MGSKGILAIINTIRLHPKSLAVLQSLSIASNDVDDQVVDVLEQIIGDESNSLYELDLSNNKIGANGILVLAKAMSNPNCHLTSLGTHSYF